MERILTAVFLINTVLVIVDAALGYFVAPLLVQRSPDSPADGAMTVRDIRRLLSVMVALSMFCNCYAFFRQHAVLLIALTGLVVLDISVQLVVRRRMGRQ